MHIRLKKSRCPNMYARFFDRNMSFNTMSHDIMSMRHMTAMSMRGMKKQRGGGKNDSRLPLGFALVSMMTKPCPSSFHLS